MPRLTTGECALKRLAPQPVVSLRPAVSESAGNRQREYPGIWFHGPEITVPHGGHPQSRQIPTPPRAAESFPPRPLSLVHPLPSPYFSSSLTLNTWGAVSPARHIPIGPRPHPIFDEGEEMIAGFCKMRTSLNSRRRNSGFAQVRIVLETIAANRGGDPAALSGRDLHVSHSPAPWQSRGRAGMLELQSVDP